MKQLLIGTTNLAKFNDFKELLSQFPLEIVSLYDTGIKAPEETGDTFEDNAILKARYYFQKTGIPTLADDGGFEIEALHGEPGVKSHRWINGKESADEDLIKEVYRRTETIPKSQRHCQLRTVIAVASPFGVITAEGSIKGEIADKPSRKRIKGFPFRSVMYLPNYGKNFADLTKEELSIMNHRMAAVEKVKDIFKELSK